MKVICRLYGQWEIKRSIKDLLGISSLLEYEGRGQGNHLNRVVEKRKEDALPLPWEGSESHHPFLHS